MMFSVWGLEGLASLWRPLGQLRHLERLCVGGIFFQSDVIPGPDIDVEVFKSDPRCFEILNAQCKKLWSFPAPVYRTLIPRFVAFKQS